uniref:AIG1-type G domain-containing protein n=1 Tax=Salarias fasciatus TaxID=181472 RepID=A0A672HA36_SALFA
FLRGNVINHCPTVPPIVLLGGRNSGKSCVGNLLLGKEEFVTRERTACSRRLGVAAGRRLTVVDTPGWWCDFGVRDTYKARLFSDNNCSKKRRTNDLHVNLNSGCTLSRL